MNQILGCTAYSTDWVIAAYS